MSIDYQEKIPNNVNLADDKRLQRALETWQPGFLSWWAEQGPLENKDREVYLRTAISVDADGWANFGHVRLPEYRWAFSSTRPKTTAGLPMATIRASRSGRTCRANTAPSCAA